MAGFTYGTAKRYYELWANEIKRSLESRDAAELGGISEAQKQKVANKASRSARVKR